MPAGHPHAVYGKEQFKMLLVDKETEDSSVLRPYEARMYYKK